jgi:hypothetical protein
MKSEMNSESEALQSNRSLLGRKILSIQVALLALLGLIPFLIVLIARIDIAKSSRELKTFSEMSQPLVTYGLSTVIFSITSWFIWPKKKKR